LGFDARALVNFVAHLGLASEANTGFVTGAQIYITHMGPPLEYAAESERPQVLGTVPLTVDEELRIGMFIDERIGEHEAASVRADRQYVVRPHTRPHLEADGTVLYWLFSCAGFVVEAYRAAGLDIISTDEDRLPLISLETICYAYPHARDRATLRAQIGIPGDGPWQVLLAGHVLHALNQQSADIRLAPYEPQPGDEFFP
jgi:hypothetical protein